jgi:3-methyladenine DNA glycosylase AlkC
VAEINEPLLSLSFGARSSLIADTLKKYLPDDFPEAAQILIDSLGAEAAAESLTGSEGFIIMPQCLFISRYGLEHFEISIKALYEMTKRFTAEGDIRPFLQTYPAKTLAFLHQITQDESPFARRLASEGSRPRLPLSSRLPRFQKDPTPVIEILDKLKTDPNLMVRRSVANNLNDISKDNPDVVVATLQQWQKIDNQGTQWIISHALRTLLKQGHPGALRIMGYEPDIQLAVSELQLSAEVLSPEGSVGETLTFEFTITSHEPERCKLMIDYVVHYMKANGKQAPKVFKAAKKTLSPGETIRIKKRRSFKKISTRTYYSGKHSLEVQINGRRYSMVDFMVEM